MKNLKRNRRSKEEGHMAALIRRKMIQRDHGDKSKYTRKEKHKGAWRSPSSVVYLQGKIKVMIQATMHSHSVLEEVIYHLQSKGAIVDPCIVDDLITCVKTHAKVEFKDIK